MFQKFNLQGNRPHIRTEQELAAVDKAAADEAFKTYKKLILDESLLAKGFVKYKTNAYVRKNKIQLLEYIDLQKEHYGSKTFTVNYALMPLYIPLDHLMLGFGDRLGSAVCGKDIWWDFADEAIARKSFQNVADAIDRFVLPWFEKYSDEKTLEKKLFADRRKSRWLSYPNEEWLNALNEQNDKDEIVSENRKKLKLPKAL